MKTVHVVAWHYDGGAGFDWYFKPDAADAAFETEKQTARELSAESWTAYRFDYQPTATTPEAITDEIDGQIDHLCSTAPQTYPKPWKSI